MDLSKYSVGIGDRFSHEGPAQLRAVMRAAEEGVLITPVWNKSHREHTIIGTHPMDVRREADGAVDALEWTSDYCVDADHIGLDNVDLFIEASDFFTLDVADCTGLAADEDAIRSFVSRNRDLTGDLDVAGCEEKFEVRAADLEECARKYLLAVQQAGRIYRRIEQSKGRDRFVTEVSMDETDRPQKPEELLFILVMVAQEGIPAQTIAPKFTGRFNKGVDYDGDVERFDTEFRADLAVIDFAVEHFNLPENLKLSIHSGSDKFSLYAPMSRALKDFNAGLHIKTAGTTWLEEVIGLAEAEDDGLALARDIYRQALRRHDELCEPYAPVLDIREENLPEAQEVDAWDGRTFAAALRHDRNCPLYNPDLRQLLHVAYKIAAEMGDEFYESLRKHRDIIGQHVTNNIYRRHIRPLFLS
jgi:hypothetical protein